MSKTLDEIWDAAEFARLWRAQEDATTDEERYAATVALCEYKMKAITEAGIKGNAAELQPGEDWQDDEPPPDGDDEPDAGKDLSAMHAPKGGVSIGGQQFKGGEFIPGDVVAAATPEEKATLAAGGQALLGQRDARLGRVGAGHFHITRLHGRMPDLQRFAGCTPDRFHQFLQRDGALVTQVEHLKAHALRSL